MGMNLGRGCWRLWLFFNLLWVVFCSWQVYEARMELKKAHELETYYVKASLDARRLQSRLDIITPSVTKNLHDQVEANKKILAEENHREGKFSRFMWEVPAVTLFFALGIPWVCEGFADL